MARASARMIDSTLLVERRFELMGGRVRPIRSVPWYNSALPPYKIGLPRQSPQRRRRTFSAHANEPSQGRRGSSEMSSTNASTTTHPIQGGPGTLPSDERQRLDDIGFMTCMTLVMLGNYSQTGHFGGPLAYTPFNVATHLLGPDRGGLRYDYRRPKHPFGDKFLMAAGHSV